MIGVAVFTSIILWILMWEEQQIEIVIGFAPPWIKVLIAFLKAFFMLVFLGVIILMIWSVMPHRGVR